MLENFLLFFYSPSGPFLFLIFSFTLSLFPLSFSISLPLSLLSLPSPPCSPLSGHPLCLPHQPNLGQKPSPSLEAHLSHCLKPLCRTTDRNPPPLVWSNHHWKSIHHWLIFCLSYQLVMILIWLCFFFFGGFCFAVWVDLVLVGCGCGGGGGGGGF